MKLSVLIVLVFCKSILLTSCNNDNANKELATQTTAATKTDSILVFDKLIGTWLMEGSSTFERWTKQAAGQYRSEVFSINNKDTVWKEQATIFKENNNWIFENTVKDQNDGKAIRFTATFLNEAVVQFSNTLHDFPQQIRYHVKNDNSIEAFIAGPNSKGGTDTIPFNYSRKD